MKQFLTLYLIPFVLAGGCASGPQRLSAVDFQQTYLAYRGNSLEGYSYTGETNGDVYVMWMRAPLSSGSKPKEKLYYTEAAALPSGFLEELRKEAKVEQKD
jgi:hypothetical protein